MHILCISGGIRHESPITIAKQVASVFHSDNRLLWRFSPEQALNHCPDFDPAQRRSFAIAIECLPGPPHLLDAWWA